MLLKFTLGDPPNCRIGQFKYVTFILHLAQVAQVALEKDHSTRKRNPHPIMP
jgi:hypothetical protein